MVLRSVSIHLAPSLRASRPHHYRSVVSIAAIASEDAATSCCPAPILCYAALVSFSERKAAMKCPRCQTDLVAEQQYHGIVVDRCPSCDGRWLGLNELDQLEATVPSTSAERRGPPPCPQRGR